MTQAARMALYNDSKAKCGDAFFRDLHALLARLSPTCRKTGLEQLTPIEQQGLEAWMLSNQNSGQVICCPPKVCRSMRSKAPVKSSVVTFSQRTQKGTTRWYYAVVCLPGLHILSRMRRERALAVDDSQVLASTKRCVKEAAQKGQAFDQAVREALQSHAGQRRSRCPARAGGAILEPHRLQLRFYATLDLGRGFSTMLRAPCCYNLEEALVARRRLQAALNDQGSMLGTLPFSHCNEVLERLRCTHRALFQEAGAVDASERAFHRVRRMLLQQRESRAYLQLQRLLDRKRRASEDVISSPAKRMRRSERAAGSKHQLFESAICRKGGSSQQKKGPKKCVQLTTVVM